MAVMGRSRGRPCTSNGAGSSTSAIGGKLVTKPLGTERDTAVSSGGWWRVGAADRIGGQTVSAIGIEGGGRQRRADRIDRVA